MANTGSSLPAPYDCSTCTARGQAVQEMGTEMNKAARHRAKVGVGFRSMHEKDKLADGGNGMRGEWGWIIDCPS